MNKISLTKGGALLINSPESLINQFQLRQLGAVDQG